MNPLFLTLLVGLFILGGVIIGNYTTHSKKFVSFSIGGAFGVIMAIMVAELIPEAYLHLELSENWRTIAMLVITAAIGFLIMNILDTFIPHHEHESKHTHKHKDDKCHDEHLGHVGVLATVALFLHNVIEGMTLYATASASISAGYLLCVGIGLHNIPLGIVVSNTFKNKKKSIISAIALVISSFIGGVIMALISPINEFLIGILISLTVGMMIYLCFMELFGQIVHSENKKFSVAGIIIGVLVIAISMMLGGHHH